MPTEPIVPFSYRAGSIVTIEMWNFVTYTHAYIENATVKNAPPRENSRKFRRKLTQKA